MANNDQDHGGMEADMAAPLMVGQRPEVFANSTKDNENRGYGDGLRHRRHVAGRKTKKITGMSTSSEMTESDEEHGGMEADDMATPLLQGQRAELLADRTHDDDRRNEDGLRRRRTVAGRKMAEITVKNGIGQSFQLEVDLSSDTIRDVAASIEEEWCIPFKQQRIIFNGKQPQTDCILAHCGIKEGSTVRVLLLLRGGGNPEATKERWCTYSHRALLFSVALFSAYLNNNSTSISPNIVRDILFVTFVVLFVIINAALALALEQLLRLPNNYGDALVCISWFLLESVTFLLSISFNTYFAFVFLALLALVVAVAIIFQAVADTRGDDEGSKNEDFDRLFKLSEGIASSGGLITVVLGHYDTVVGPGKDLVGFFFFWTIALGLYLMMVITVRAVSRRHATWLARALVVLLVITLIIASVDFIRSPLRSHPQVR